MRHSWIARGAASAERGRRLMELRGVTPNGHPLWERREVRPLMDLHPEYGAVFPQLPSRTKTAVYQKRWLYPAWLCVPDSGSLLDGGQMNRGSSLFSMSSALRQIRQPSSGAEKLDGPSVNSLATRSK